MQHQLLTLLQLLLQVNQPEQLLLLQDPEMKEAVLLVVQKLRLKVYHGQQLVQPVVLDQRQEHHKLTMQHQLFLLLQLLLQADQPEQLLLLQDPEMKEAVL
uniref:Secreted protein n=1 Tax=Plectus sambesii TaxID=2011161 RepID=A0A914W7C3_9BILA